MAEHGALGVTGGPRGVADEGGVIGSDGVQSDGLAVGQTHIRADHQDRPARSLPDPLRLVGAFDDGGSRANVGHDMDQLALGIGGVGRDHHQPGPERTHVGDQGGDR